MIRTPLRDAAEAACGARVRADRQDALYVAARGDEDAFLRAGFSAKRRGALWTLTPGDALFPILGAWLDEKKEDDELLARLARLRGDAICDAERALTTEGVKRLETGAPFDAAYERRVRETAAICLRTGAGGGLLWMARALMIRREE